MVEEHPVVDLLRNVRLEAYSVSIDVHRRQGALEEEILDHGTQWGVQGGGEPELIFARKQGLQLGVRLLERRDEPSSVIGVVQAEAGRAVRQDLNNLRFVETERWVWVRRHGVVIELRRDWGTRRAPVSPCRDGVRLGRVRFVYDLRVLCDVTRAPLLGGKLYRRAVRLLGAVGLDGDGPNSLAQSVAEAHRVSGSVRWWRRVIECCYLLLVHTAVAHQVADVLSAVPGPIDEELQLLYVREVVLQADLVRGCYILHHLVNEVVAILLLVRRDTLCEDPRGDLQRQDFLEQMERLVHGLLHEGPERDVVVTRALQQEVDDHVVEVVVHCVDLALRRQPESMHDLGVGSALVVV